MKKKGQIQDHINDLILGAIALFILASLIIGFYTVFEKKAPEYACRTSVIARENLQLELNNMPDVKRKFPIQCDTIDKTLPEKLSNGLSVEEKKEQTMKEIADHMAKCWWMFDEGRYNNIFGDTFINDNLCHACYSFEISPSAGIGELSINEMYAYLSTHSFEQGLLEGGLGSIGGMGQHSFTAQSGDSASTAPNKMFSNNQLSRGLADYSNVFAGKEADKTLLQARLAQISGGGALEPALIIVNRLSDASISKDSDLAYQFFSEWKLGDYQKKNGIVILIAVENGVVLYATQSGADALLPTYKIEQLLSSLDEPMSRQVTSAAILQFAETFKNEVQALGDSDHINDLLTWQRSYSAYIGGGVRGPSANEGDQIATGAITTPKGFTRLVPGVRYAISYISPKQDGCLGDWDWCGSNAPNMIALSEHEQLFGNKRICSVT